MPQLDSRSGSASTVSKEDAPHVLSPSENSSTPECELELSLSLAVGGGGNGGGYLKSKKPQRAAPKILTDEDFNSVVSAASPSSSSSSSSPTQNQANGIAGTKRSADSVSPSNAASQVVGWPPIRSYRMNNMANNGKSFSNKAFVPTNEKRNGTDAAAALEKDNDLRNHEESNQKQRVSLKSLFVKVNMDGVAIGRKVDLSTLNCYQTLAQTLDTMFSAPSKNANSYGTTRGSKLLDGSSGYLLTYEDKDGDWMLVGDVPWSMFLNTVKRLRIMRSNEANGNIIR